MPKKWGQLVVVMRSILWMILIIFNFRNSLSPHTNYFVISLILQTLFVMGFIVDTLRIFTWRNAYLIFAESSIEVPVQLGLKRKKISLDKIISIYIKDNKNQVFIYQKKNKSIFQNFNVIWLNDYTDSNLLREEFDRLSERLKSNET